MMKKGYFELFLQSVSKIFIEAVIRIKMNEIRKILPSWIWFQGAKCIKINTILSTELWRAGEGRRPWATTISLSVSHINFFVFRQPWATTISPSVPPHMTLPDKTTFLNGILRAFKVWFSKIQPRHAKKHNSNHFFNST